MKVSKKSFCLLLVVFAVTESLTGCGSKQESVEEIGNSQKASAVGQAVESNTVPVPEAYLITDKNYFDYQPGLECAAFSSAYVLRHFGEETKGLELFKDFPGKLPGGNGVFPTGVEQFWNERQGYSAQFKDNGTVDELKRLVSTGIPVIVFIHVEEPYSTPHNTHYLPLIGYDKDYFYFAESLDYLANCKDEPSLGYNRKTEISKFERLWRNIDGAWDQPYFVITKDPV